MENELKKCPDCKGRGYHHCPCWPGDCICGQDDLDCENCDGTGWIEPLDYYEVWDDQYIDQMEK